MLLVFVSALYGCNNYGLTFASPKKSGTHRFVEKPPVLNTSSSSVWVSLDSFLGKGTAIEKSAVALKLKSATNKLLLKDATGFIYQASEITLGWQAVPLVTPLRFARQVVGPFSSFESAERVALELKGFGIKGSIARPQHWEVWIPKSYRLPKAMQANLINFSINSEIKPFLAQSKSFRKHNLVGPIEISAPEGLIWKGESYQGSFRLQRDSYETWTLIHKVPLEDYLAGVVPHEIGSDAPFAALKAQAVLARTWALANSHRFLIDGYHLCSDTQCQVYRSPEKASAKVKSAIKASAGKVLLWEGKPINAVYHASNGGVMAAGHEAWAMKAVPYLISKPDGSSNWVKSFKLPLNDAEKVLTLLQARLGANGLNHLRFRWSRTLNAKQIQNSLKRIYPKVSLPKEIKVISRGKSGRVVALQIDDGKIHSPLILKLDGIRRSLRELPSTLFVIRTAGNGVWNFLGGGFGHGAGLSQAGAIDLAKKGWNTKMILKHYYPSTFYGSLPDWSNSL